MTDWFEYRWIGFVTVLALAAGAAITLGADARIGFLIGFDLAGTLFLFVLGLSMGRENAAQMQEQAAKVDAGRWTVLLMSVLLSLAALAALGVELQGAKQGGLPHLLLAVVSIVVAWLLMNTMFAFHYAHCYYVGDSAGAGVRHGLEFPGTEDPDYLDFLYFALVLGMTFQVSDVNIVNSRVRRMALGHALIAFFFNLVVLALSVALLGAQV